VSRQLLNYKDSLWGRGCVARIFGTTQRDWAYQATNDGRQERYARSVERWKVRKRLLRQTGRTQGRATIKK
jgi:hypothetical protein